MWKTDLKKLDLYAQQFRVRLLRSHSRPPHGRVKPYTGWMVLSISLPHKPNAAYEGWRVYNFVRREGVSRSFTFSHFRLFVGTPSSYFSRAFAFWGASRLRNLGYSRLSPSWVYPPQTTKATYCVLPVPLALHFTAHWSLHLRPSTSSPPLPSPHGLQLELEASPLKASPPKASLVALS